MKPNMKIMKNLVSRNASDILLVGGVSAIFGAGILAIRQTPKAIQILEKKEQDRLDKVKAVAPLYIPSVLLAGVGVAQIVCSRNITKNKIAAITTAYTVTETAYKTYRDKVREYVDPETSDIIDERVAAEKIKKNPVNSKEVIITKGDVLIYDNMSGRYFKGSIDGIEKAANLINKKLRNEMTMDLNELYYELGLPPIKIGCEVGWSIDDSELTPSFTSTIAENGEPCLVLDYDVVPVN